jgi:hypothetical protein
MIHVYMSLSILESAYLFYMFRHCETTTDFGITPSPNGYWLEHVTGNVKALRICPFGRVAILPLIGLLLGRHFTPLITPRIINISLGISFFLSWMNTNALVYLLPIYIIESMQKN